jgi:hypothetical protein
MLKEQNRPEQTLNSHNEKFMNTEFYIGWMPKAPESFSTHARKTVLSLFIITIICAALLAIAQRKFSTANFEFGILTEVKGIYFNKPVACIKVINGKNIFGQLSYITIPLAGFGKHGADGVIDAVEKEKNISLDKKEITLKGTLLYNDGKLLMQIDENDKPVIAIGNNADTLLLPVKEDLGEQTIKGEIIDAKCYFGVMKPGEGKPHKDCAIRCILGGIPPVLRASNEKNENNYYLIVGANGEKMNDIVQNFVAEPATIKAKAVKYDDWIVLYVNADNGIQHYSYLKEKFGKQIQYCATDCSK